LDAEEWTLLRQPIVPLAAGDGPPWGELLLRLRDPDGRLVPPAAFLPVAERIDLIQAIDRWVIRRACELQAGGAGTLSVNLSARSASDPALGGFIQGCLAGTGADPAGLVFELTETAAIADLAAARRLAAGLRRLGSRLALDDFGAGFASFYYLKHLDVDVLKIDGEFVTDLPDDPTDRLVVGAVVGIAQGLGVPVVAEWVEDERTLAALRELGVDHAQGFHLGPPEPV
jgi:EAL domain-containing protein (putative c-di-GMP-specific phosphodiesterase class I)